jgi:hypothetical protein
MKFKLRPASAHLYATDQQPAEAKAKAKDLLCPVLKKVDS